MYKTYDERMRAMDGPWECANETVFGFLYSFSSSFWPWLMYCRTCAISRIRNDLLWVLCCALVTCGRVFIKILLPGPGYLPSNCTNSALPIKYFKCCQFFSIPGETAELCKYWPPLFVLLICYTLILQIIGRSIFRLRLFFM